MTAPTIESVGLDPAMLYHPQIIDLSPPRAETLADQIREMSQEPDLFARTVRALAIAAKVARLERAWDQIAADAMADHQAAQVAGNVVRFERKPR